MKWYYPAGGNQVATTNYGRYFIGFKASNLMVINDSETDDLEFSFDGSTSHGHVLPGEPLNLGDVELSEIYIKGKAGEGFRLWAYAK